MPTFRFDVQGGSDVLAVDLPSIAAAKCEAARYAGRLLCEAADSFWSAPVFTVTVSDESGLTLFVLTVSGVGAPAIAVVQKVQAQP